MSLHDEMENVASTGTENIGEIYGNLSEYCLLEDGMPIVTGDFEFFDEVNYILFFIMCSFLKILFDYIFYDVHLDRKLHAYYD